MEKEKGERVICPNCGILCAIKTKKYVECRCNHDKGLCHYIDTVQNYERLMKKNGELKWKP